MRTLAPQQLTAVDSQVFLQMVFVFEGLATLRALELTIACSLGQQLVLGEQRHQHEFLCKYTQAHIYVRRACSF